MQHADFLNDPVGRLHHWQLTNWSAAVRIALGGAALQSYRSAFAALLAPSIALAVYSLYSNRPMLLIWVLLSFWGFWTSSTGPSGVGMVASVLIGLIGFVCAVLRDDWLLFLSALLPGVTWFGSCAILGTTASYIIDALGKSEHTFEMLISRGILNATQVVEPSQAPEPATGPESKGESSPPAR